MQVHKDWHRETLILSRDIYLIISSVSTYSCYRQLITEEIEKT